MSPLWLWKSMLDNSLSLHQSFKGSSCSWAIFLSKVSSDCFSWVYKRERSSLGIFWFPLAKLGLISHDSKRMFVDIFKPILLVCGEPQEQPTWTLTTNVDPLLPSCVCSLLLQESRRCPRRCNKWQAKVHQGVQRASHKAHKLSINSWHPGVMLELNQGHCKWRFCHMHSPTSIMA